MSKDNGGARIDRALKELNDAFEEYAEHVPDITHVNELRWQLAESRAEVADLFRVLTELRAMQQRARDMISGTSTSLTNNVVEHILGHAEFKDELQRQADELAELAELRAMKQRAQEVADRGPMDADECREQDVAQFILGRDQ